MEQWSAVHAERLFFFFSLTLGVGHRWLVHELDQQGNLSHEQWRKRFVAVERVNR